MPTSPARIKIYIALHERLQRSDYPTKEELIDTIRDMGEDISVRSLDRYRSEMREEFGWDIRHNRTQGGYELMPDLEAISPDNLLEFFGQSIRMQFLTANLKDRKTFGEIVQFEKRSDYPGINHLEALYIACRERKQVAITHRKFGSENTETYTIHPILLKEYLNRWYVIAQVPERGGIRTFGLERISGLQVSDMSFPETELRTQIAQTFHHMVGLDDRHRKIEKVRLRFTGIGVEYEKTLPIHESATVIETSADATTFEYTLIPNFELIQRILAQADRVEVLAPEWLRKSMADYLRRAGEHYNT